MARALIVRNVDDELVRRLKLRAARHGHSAEAEHRAILEQALGKDREEFWAKAAEMRARTRGRKHTPAEVLLREERDRRSGLTE
jgi:plasmid stability protein